MFNIYASLLEAEDSHGCLVKGRQSASGVISEKATGKLIEPFLGDFQCFLEGKPDLILFHVGIDIICQTLVKSFIQMRAAIDQVGHNKLDQDVEP